ncbi:carboxyltransferase domain-containing protein [Deinococcus malanensis]|uniref:carboxyltransferase domain-containing protein n=1 Tax=Deinococcus malanensis TaxID=1706855 RepID=UPI00363A0E48
MQGRSTTCTRSGSRPGSPSWGGAGRPAPPRRDTPRLKVPFNAVAVANAQSCVYVLPSPGGWHLLGTALTTIYDPNRDAPFLLSPGDTVRFVEASGRRRGAGHPPAVA